MDSEPIDVFVSYAGEEYEIAAALATALTNRELRVWLARAELRVGEPLVQSVDKALNSARFGVVVLSHHYFSKQWPQRELDGLVMREMTEQRIIVLPIWHDIGRDEISRYSPPLANKVALRTSDGIEAIAAKVAALFGTAPASQRVRLSDAAASRGFWYRSIALDVRVGEVGTRWHVTWQVEVVAEEAQLHGFDVSFRIDDLLAGSLVESVAESDVEIEGREARHPRSMARFFRFGRAVARGEARAITYRREFLKARPQLRDFYVSKGSLKCEELATRIEFDSSPKKLSYRVTDRSELVVFEEEPITLDAASLYASRRVAPPDLTLAYGFWWAFKETYE